MATISAVTSTRPSMTRILRQGAIATVITVVVNVLLFLVGSTFTFPPDALTPLGIPVPLGAVATLTLGAGVVATIGYVVLTRFLSQRIARIIMWVVAAAVLLFMATTPFGITNVPMAENIILQIMHLVAGVLPIWFLTRE